MRKNKGIEKVYETNVKQLFSAVPIGSIFFGDKYDRLGRNSRYVVTKQLGDFEQPIIKYDALHPFDRTLFEVVKEFNKYVSYADIVEWGYDMCILTDNYKVIDLNYVGQVKDIRNAKTLKELKIVLERGLK